MGEAFGFVGLIVILILLVSLLLRLLSIMDRVEDINLRLIVVRCIWLAGYSSLFNIGAMVGVVPLTGITLPLLKKAFGGTSLLFIMLALAPSFHISRYTVHE